MANFDLALEKTLVFEGGYSDHPLDSGGKTRYGITERVAQMYGYSGEMKDLPIDFAKKIYYAGYWEPLRLNEVRNQYIANYIFDWAVNGGVRTAARYVQIALNLEKIWVDIDGVIGPRTIEAVNKANPDVMMKILKGLRFHFYYEIIRKDSTQEVFFLGWLKRV
jgi:lysozyme family protein